MFTIVGVIIPTYKGRNTISNTLNSLVAQTQKLFLVLLVQDGDNEDYSDIIKEYQERGLSIGIIKEEVNRGPGLARQIGFNATTMCDYITFLDADDMLMPRAIEVMYKESKRRNLDIIAASFIRERVDGIGDVVHPKDGSCTWCLGKMYRRGYLEENNIHFIPELRLNEDAYFNLVAFNCTKKKAYLDEVLGIWRHNEKSLTRKEDEQTFFIESSPQYIYGQVRGLKKILEVRNKLPHEILGLTLINIYKAFMKGCFLGVDKSLYQLELLSLKNYSVVQDFLANEKIWIELIPQIPAGEVFGEKQILIYSQTFHDWIRDWIKNKETKMIAKT